MVGPAHNGRQAGRHGDAALFDIVGAADGLGDHRQTTDIVLEPLDAGPIVGILGGKECHAVQRGGAAQPIGGGVKGRAAIHQAGQRRQGEQAHRDPARKAAGRLGHMPDAKGGDQGP